MHCVPRSPGLPGREEARSLATDAGVLCHFGGLGADRAGEFRPGLFHRVYRTWGTTGKFQRRKLVSIPSTLAGEPRVSNPARARQGRRPTRSGRSWRDRVTGGAGMKSWSTAPTGCAGPLRRARRHGRRAALAVVARPDRAEAFAGIQQLGAEVVADMAEAGETPPAAMADKAYIGKFMVRFPPELHRQLAPRCGRSPHLPEPADLQPPSRLRGSNLTRTWSHRARSGRGGPAPWACD